MIALRGWSDVDLPLLHRGNTPEMTVHLGGPETDAQVQARHARYLLLTESGEARIVAIVDGDEKVGAISCWATTWHDDVDALEAGWFVVPEAQGRGVATTALALVVADARAHWPGCASARRRHADPTMMPGTPQGDHADSAATGGQ